MRRDPLLGGREGCLVRPASACRRASAPEQGGAWAGEGRRELKLFKNTGSEEGGEV